MILTTVIAIVEILFVCLFVCCYASEGSWKIFASAAAAVTNAAAAPASNAVSVAAAAAAAI